MRPAALAGTGLRGTDSIILSCIVVLVAISSLLSLAETSLTRTSRAKALSLREEKRRGAAILLRLVEHPERFLNSVLLVVLVCQLVSATLVGVLSERLFGALGVAIATVFEVVVIFVLGEAAPKTWAIQHPERAALFSAPIVGAILGFPPLRMITTALISLSNVLLPGKGLRRGPFVSEQELLAMADVAAEEEVIEGEERALIRSIITFGDTVVRNVMVPRPDMVSVSADEPVRSVIEVAIAAGYSRLPVYEEGVDDIIGVVYTKDLMKAAQDSEGDGPDRPVRALARSAHFVPETKRVAELMREMQNEKYHIAIAVDEYGGTAGLVTLEDLIEELVGEIVDEFDFEEPLIEPLAGGEFRVNARMAVSELNELLHAELPAGDWDTVGGLVFNLLGHVPTEGESVVADGHRLAAERVQGRRIGRVRIARLSEATDGGSGAPGIEPVQ